MKPIWYLVGLVLLSMGVVVLCAGIYELFNPVADATKFAHLHPGFWWGLVMVAAGGTFVLTHRKSKVE
jgi:hypothetical protein